MVVTFTNRCRLCCLCFFRSYYYCPNLGWRFGSCKIGLNPMFRRWMFPASTWRLCIVTLLTSMQMRRCVNVIYFIVDGEISVYLVKIKVVSITSELISYHFTNDWYDLYFHSSLWTTSDFFLCPLCSKAVVLSLLFLLLFCWPWLFLFHHSVWCLMPCPCGCSLKRELVTWLVVKLYSRTAVARTFLGPGNLFETWVVRATEVQSWYQVRKQMAII